MYTIKIISKHSALPTDLRHSQTAAYSVLDHSHIRPARWGTAIPELQYSPASVDSVEDQAEVEAAASLVAYFVRRTVAAERRSWLTAVDSGSRRSVEVRNTVGALVVRPVGKRWGYMRSVSHSYRFGNDLMRPDVERIGNSVMVACRFAGIVVRWADFAREHRCFVEVAVCGCFLVPMRCESQVMEMVAWSE